jgi:hypothetical protein
VKDAVNQLSKEIESRYPGLPNTRWIDIRLLEGDRRVIEALENNEFLIPS